MRFHCSSMPKFLGFSIFDVGVFLSFEMLKMLQNSIWHLTHLMKEDFWCAKYQIFGTPDGDALRAFLSKVLKMLNAKCYFLAFLAHQMIKTHLHQIC